MLHGPHLENYFFRYSNLLHLAPAAKHQDRMYFQQYAGGPVNEMKIFKAIIDQLEAYISCSSEDFGEDDSC